MICSCFYEKQPSRKSVVYNLTHCYRTNLSATKITHNSLRIASKLCWLNYNTCVIQNQSSLILEQADLGLHYPQKKQSMWSENTTITNGRPTHDTVRKSHRTLTVTRHQEYSQSKETNSLFPIKMITKLDGHKVMNNKTRTKHTNNGSNNKQ